MKKIKLGGQLLILFTSIILMSICLFSVIILSRLQNIYSGETEKRLETVVKNSKDDWEDVMKSDFSINTDMMVVFIRGIRSPLPYQYNNYIANGSSDLETIISKDDVDIILKNVLTIPGSKGTGTESYKGGNLYYSYETSSDGDVYFVAITDDSYSNSLKQKISLQVIFIFSLVIVFSALLIFAWSRTFTTRIQRIKAHVRNLPFTEYSEEYVDNGLDEVSELSRSIETMRVQLKNSENDKREMLQNISHDFKTPIAVIKSYAEAINDGMDDGNSANVIINQVDLLEKKVFKLLQYNRLQYLSMDQPFEDINMKDVITEVLNTYRFQTNIKIDVELDDDVFFKGYKENYYTVIDNIIDNAKRYAKNEIKVILHTNYLEIFNDGDPIDDKFINGLFKAYEKGSKGQFGLGMSIVKKTLDFFKMNLEVKNSEKGVSFIISKKIYQRVETI